MIPGIVASSAITAPSTELDDYAGATIIMDFENDVYQVSGSDVDVSTLIDRTNTLTAGGLVLDWNTEEPPIDLLTAFSSVLDEVNGYTMLFDFDQFESGTTYVGVLLRFFNGTFDSGAGGRNDFQAAINDARTEAYFLRLNAGDYTRVESFSASHSLSDGAPRRLAISRAPTRIAISVNGAATTVQNAETGSVAGTPAYTTHTLGGNPGEDYLDINCVLRKLIVYPLKSDSSLPALSSI